jgi:pimeloyl-ACP methyl ester carboxylesterase
MASFVLIPGAGGMASYWHGIVPRLERAKHEAIAVDLPGDDERAGLDVYAELVVRAIGKRRDVVLVAGSLGGFTAALVGEQVPIERLIFVNAMIPRPGETAGAWWETTGAVKARTTAAARGGYSAEFDVRTYFLHDVPPEVLRGNSREVREEAPVVFSEPCAFTSWPKVPTHVIAGADDRFFPVEFQRRVALDRLHLPIDVVPGGHLVALSRPDTLAAKVLGYLG